jgi:hypothetical protein
VGIGRRARGDPGFASRLERDKYGVAALMERMVIETRFPVFAGL